jgi:hypothetical protein
MAERQGSDEAVGMLTPRRTTRYIWSATRHTLCAQYRSCRRSDCQRCQEVIGYIAFQAIHRRALIAESLLAITLTVPADSAPLRDQIRRLQRNFVRLTRRAAWKRSIVGGIRSVDVTYNRITQLWQPHLHILAEGWPTERADIAHDWLMLTSGDQKRIKRIHDDRYRWCMARYVTKPPQRELFEQPSALEEFVWAKKRLRLRQTFGTFGGTRLTPRRVARAVTPSALDPRVSTQDRTNRGHVVASLL